MEATAAKQARETSVNPAPMSTPERHMPLVSAPEAPLEKKAVGYGLPCSRCHAYYPADMHACPICKSPERISANQAALQTTARPAQHASAPSNGAPLDEERERLLKELKSQAFASHTRLRSAIAAIARPARKPTGWKPPCTWTQKMRQKSSMRRSGPTRPIPMLLI